jgi:hypothetical protein
MVLQLILRRHIQSPGDRINNLTTTKEWKGNLLVFQERVGLEKSELPHEIDP